MHEISSGPEEDLQNLLEERQVLKLQLRGCCGLRRKEQTDLQLALERVEKHLSLLLESGVCQRWFS